MDIYSLMLQDGSAPAFVTADKPYFGTASDFDGLFEARKLDNATKLAALTKRFEPVICDGEQIVAHGSGQYRYVNPWGFPYIVQWDEAVSEHLWLQWENRYLRCVRARFKHPKFHTPDTAESPLPLGGMLWGFPHIAEYAPPWLSFRLYMAEMFFSSRDDCLLDIRKGVLQPNYHELFSDVFGDG